MTWCGRNIHIYVCNIGPAVHSTPMQKQRHEPSEREEEGLLQPQYGQESYYQDQQPTAVRTAPQSGTLEREKPIKAPRMHTTPQPVCLWLTSVHTKDI